MFQWGWNESWQKKFEEGSYTGIPGRVVDAHQEIYRVVSEAGDGLAEISGKLRYQGNVPVVGDFVVVQPGSRFRIEAVLPPQSTIVRRASGTTLAPQMIASNVDLVFVVEAMNSPISLRRIERYLAMARQGNCDAVILLSKSDLVDHPGQILSKMSNSLNWNPPIYPVNALAKEGLTAIRDHLESGMTGAFFGMSGVGKSTLLNALLDSAVQQTGDVRNSDQKGRHTTTTRTLFLLPSGAMIIDTPGMRELALWDAESDIDDTFLDVLQWTHQCRYRNCSHQGEPGCMVVEAIEMGQLEESRFLGYCKLQRETAYQIRKGDAALQSQAREYWKRASAHGRANRKAKLKGLDRHDEQP